MKRLKITAEMHDAMRIMRETGATYQKIGDAFGLHHASVIFDLCGKRKTEYRHSTHTTAQLLRIAADELEKTGRDVPTMPTTFSLAHGPITGPRTPDQAGGQA